jgi:hypothetical protein
MSDSGVTDDEVVDSYEGASRWLSALLWTALGAGALWVLLRGAIQLRFYLGDGLNGFQSEGEAEIWAWVQAFDGISYSVFLVALGSYVLIWLRARQM